MNNKYILFKVAPLHEHEVLQIKSSSDYYETLGLSRYENIDFAVLKRMYKKKVVFCLNYLKC